MKKIFDFFSKRHTFATLFTIAIIMLGLNAARTLKKDIIPEVDFGEVVITTAYPGASPEDVELNVTNKIEDELKGVTGIKRITSTSMENVSVINVTIDIDSKNLEKVKTDVRDAVGRVTDFPAEVTDSPLVTEIDTSQISILEVGISGDLPYEEIRRISRQFEKKLKEVPGVSRLEKFGYRAREVKVEVNPARLERYQISLREIIQAIEARNIRLAGGTFESYTSEKNVVTLAQFEKPTDVGDVIVRSTFDGPLVRVKDLAVVKEGFEDPTVMSKLDGKEAISFLVYKTENADIVRTIKAIKKMVREETGEGLFAGYVDIQDSNESKPNLFNTLRKFVRRGNDQQKIYRYGPVNILLAQDQSRFVQNRYRIVLTNGAIGLVLVLIILGIFLNIRTAFWVAVGIPVSITGVFFLLPLFGRFLDTVSLASLVLVIGIIVDDAIIISESIFYRRSVGDEPVEAAARGTNMVFLPVLTTILTTFLAFAPMLFLKGVFGKFVFVIPLTVSLALFVSLGESLFALPAHLARGMDRSKKGAHRETTRKWFDSFRSFYRKLARGFLKFRYPMVVLFIGSFVLAIWYARNNMEFLLFPSTGAETISIDIECPTGTSLEATADKVEELENIIETLPENELETFVTRIGSLGIQGGGPGAGQAENYANIILGLTPYSERERDADAIVEDLRSRTGKIEDIDKITYLVVRPGPPVGRPITLRVIGSDDEKRREVADRIEEYLASQAGVKDIDRDDKLGKEQIEIKINYTRLSRLGVTVADLARNVRIAFDGQQVTSIREGDEDIDFRVLFTEEARRDTRYLNNLTVPNNQGRLIKLKDFALLDTGPGLNAVRHFDGIRATTVTADVDQDVTTPVSVIGPLLNNLDAEKNWPDMEIKVGGEAEESMESIKNLGFTFLVAFVGIYFLLVLLFKSFTQPFLVLVIIPFGIAAVIFTLAIHGEPLSFIAIIGTIGLAGVVVNDSLVLVSHLNELKQANPGKELRDVVALGTSNRLRAIILTSITTIAGVLPLAYGIGGIDYFISPMALALGYGLIFATPLTLVLIPCLYMIWNDIGRLFRRTGPAAGGNINL
jgi:multidrug efflux pump subunit AcrB